MRSFLIFTLVASSWLQAQVNPQNPPAPTPHREANFESERQQADELFRAEKPLEALPLYQDLSRQDPSVAVFAERCGAGLFAKEATIIDQAERMRVHLQAIAQLKRAAALGDNSAYVRSVLIADSKTLVGAVIAGIPLTVGYTYHGKPEAQKAFREAEAAFARSDWGTAVNLYIQAAGIDPTWYDAALYAGDSYFRARDVANAGVWFAKAIAIDPDRETAYRYWGDALFRAGDTNGAREKMVDAVIAEPYGNAAFAELGQWAQRMGRRLGKPAISRPELRSGRPPGFAGVAGKV